MKKFEKTKVWIKEHKEEIVSFSAIAGVVALYAGMVVVAIKVTNDYERKAEIAQQQLMEAVSRGASVLPAPNGEYWIIEK